jgi:hypothetical protein
MDLPVNRQHSTSSPNALRHGVTRRHLVPNLSLPDSDGPSEIAVDQFGDFFHGRPLTLAPSKQDSFYLSQQYRLIKPRADPPVDQCEAVCGAVDHIQSLIVAHNRSAGIVRPENTRGRYSRLSDQICGADQRSNGLVINGGYQPHPL